ncbi:putative Glycosyl transferase, group 1 [Vibrio chagasii]|nr:putative Glycosyl transferase, group 1 [Vibrio chagasii]CAH7484487.1 putative Glycosyl transferase, group 1 [Vibrio chagasii]
MKKKILVISSSLGCGGAERIAIQCANGFDELGYQAVIFSIKKDDQYESEVNQRVKVIKNEFLKVSNSLFSIVDTIHKEDPDIIFCSQNYICFFVHLAKLLARHKKSKLVLREGSTPSCNLSNSFKGKVVKACARFSYKRAHLTIATCDYVKMDMSKFFSIPEEKIKVINNPVSINSDLLNEARKKEPVIEEPFMIAVGRLHPVKNFDFLIRSFANVVNQTNANLVILGEGEERANLEALIAKLELKDRVKLKGFVNNPFPIIMQAKLLAITSLFEGYPNVVAQALSLGTNVVGVMCPGAMGEMLPSDCLLSERDEKAFSELIMEKFGTIPQGNLFNSNKRFAEIILDKLE